MGQAPFFFSSLVALRSHGLGASSASTLPYLSACRASWRVEGVSRSFVAKLALSLERLK